MFLRLFHQVSAIHTVLPRLAPGGAQAEVMDVLQRRALYPLRCRGPCTRHGKGGPVGTSQVKT